tara:strand:- start:70 stop:237 length:168 start_codon:yes stop_codon:yes gene_type:complete
MRRRVHAAVHSPEEIIIALLRHAFQHLLTHTFQDSPQETTFDDGDSAAALDELEV